MSIGKIVIAVVVLFALAITIFTLVSQSSKERSGSQDNVEIAGSESKHFDLNLEESVNIKSNS